MACQTQEKGRVRSRSGPGLTNESVIERPLCRRIEPVRELPEHGRQFIDQMRTPLNSRASAVTRMVSSPRHRSAKNRQNTEHGPARGPRSV